MFLFMYLFSSLPPVSFPSIRSALFLLGRRHISGETVSTANNNSRLPFTLPAATLEFFQCKALFEENLIFAFLKCFVFVPKREMLRFCSQNEFMFFFRKKLRFFGEKLGFSRTYVYVCVCECLCVCVRVKVFTCRK